MLFLYVMDLLDSLLNFFMVIRILFARFRILNTIAISKQTEVFQFSISNQYSSRYTYICEFIDR